MVGRQDDRPVLPRGELARDDDVVGRAGQHVPGPVGGVAPVQGFGPAVPAELVARPLAEQVAGGGAAGHQRNAGDGVRPGRPAGGPGGSRAREVAGRLGFGQRVGAGPQAGEAVPPVQVGGGRPAGYRAAVVGAGERHRHPRQRQLAGRELAVAVVVPVHRPGQQHRHVQLGEQVAGAVAAGRQRDPRDHVVHRLVAAQGADRLPAVVGVGRLGLGQRVGARQQVAEEVVPAGIRGERGRHGGPAVVGAGEGDSHPGQPRLGGAAQPVVVVVGVHRPGQGAGVGVLGEQVAGAGGGRGQPDADDAVPAGVGGAAQGAGRHRAGVVRAARVRVQGVGAGVQAGERVAAVGRRGDVAVDLTCPGCRCRTAVR